MEGLEAVELLKSEVLIDNETFRFDSEYFRKEYLNNIKILKNKNGFYLKEFIELITGGATPLGANYEVSGIPFLRVQNIMQNYFNLNDVVYLNKQQDEEIKRSRLKYKDVLLTITGVSYGKSATVNKELINSNINQHSVKITLKENSINPYFLSTFLNSKYGKLQSDKNIVGVTRPALDYDVIRKFIIPKIDISFQNKIEELHNLSYQKTTQSKTLYSEAEAVLLEEVGLSSLTERGKSPLTNMGTKSPLPPFKKGGIERGVVVETGQTGKTGENTPLHSPTSPTSPFLKGVGGIKTHRLKGGSEDKTHHLKGIGGKTHHLKEVGGIKTPHQQAEDIKNTGGLAIPYNRNLKQKSRDLRNNSTLSEIILWKKIKNDALGYRFNRQKPLLNFIVDFYCPTLKLAIEIDGSSHDGKEEYDNYRQQLIEEYGVEFLRIPDYLVKKDLPNVLLMIEAKIKEMEITLTERVAKSTLTERGIKSPLPPLKRGEGELEGINIKSLSESFGTSGRLDAEYYQLKYEEYEKVITSQKHTFVKDEYLHITKKSKKEKKGYNYIEIGDVNTGDGSYQSNYILTEYLPANAKNLVQKGDILISKVRPYRGAVTIIDTEKADLIVSGAFTILRKNPNSIYNNQVLQVLLRSSVYKDWLLKFNVGTSYPVIKDDNVLNLPIPFIKNQTQEKIAEKIEKSFALKKESERLLEVAKQAVEMAIEEGEEKAVKFINKRKSF